MMLVGRRGALGGLLGALAIPALVRAASLMPVSAFRPVLWGDGVHDDTRALQWAIDEAAKGCGVVSLPRGDYVFAGLVHLPDSDVTLDFNRSHVHPAIGEDHCLYLRHGHRDNCLAIRNATFGSLLRPAKTMISFSAA